MNNLEATVIEFQRAGDAWIEAKLKCDLLEEDQKAFLASLINELEQSLSDDTRFSETMLDRKCRGSKQYRQYITGMCMARADMLKKKVRFDALGMLFEARRSEKAFEREAVKKGVFDSGR
jgi:hypothetical protein